MRISPLLAVAIAGLVVAGALGVGVLLGRVQVGGAGAGFYSFPGATLSIPSGCQGVTVTSVSRPSFIGTNAANLAALNWILGFASGGAECFQWGQSASDLSAGTSGQVKNGLTFAATDYKEHITYDVSPDGGQIYIFDYWPADLGISGSQLGGTYDYQTAGDGWIWVKSGAPLPVCTANQDGKVASAEVILHRGGLGYGFGGFGEAFKLYCVAYTQVGATARLLGPGKRHEAMFQVSNGVEALRMPLGVTEGSVGTEFRFPGSATAAATLKMVSISSNPSALDPNTARLVGLYDLRGGRWKVVTEGNLQTNYLTNSFAPVKARVDGSNVLTQGANVPDATDSLLTAMQNADLVYFGIPEAKIVTAPGFTETFSGGQSGGRLEYVGPRTFYVTQYQLLASAEWVGVYLPSGKPLVQQVSPLDMGIGTTGTVTATVKNDAPVAASFNFDASCSPATVNAVNAPRLLPFAAGEAKNVQLTFSKGTTTEAVSAQCTVRVCDSESPSVCDSRATTVTAQATGACVPGTQVPLASEIQVCGPDGRYRTLAACPLGVDVGPTAGTYQCAVSGGGQTPTPPPGIPTPVPSLPPGGFVRPGPSPWVILGVAAMVGVLIVSVAWVLVRRREPPVM